MSEPNKDGTDMMMALLMGLSGPRASRAWTEAQEIQATSFLTLAEHWINETATEIVRVKEENERLKAEVERLRASSFVTAVPVEKYERLIKAGDAMVELLKDEDYNTEPDEYCMKEVVAWNAAKEGKQP